MATSKLPKLYLVVGLITPVSAMFGSQLLGRGPASAQAGFVDEPAGASVEQLVAIEVPQLGQAQMKIDPASLRSPFWFEPRNAGRTIAPPARSDPVRADPEPAETGDVGVPLIDLSAVLPHPTNPAAVINGKPVRLGKPIVDGWTLASVASDGRSVVIVHRTGWRLRVRLKNQP